MNIVMIGHSNAGKTTYMAALYKRMSQGIYDYTMRVSIWNMFMRHVCGTYNNNNEGDFHYSINDAQQEEKDLQLLADQLMRGVYPPSTAIRQYYSFKLQYKDLEGVNFDWFDYRGGALVERTSQSSDVEELNRQISKSDALLVFIDSTQLVRFNAEDRRSLRRLVYLVRNAFTKVQQSEEHYFPVSFLLTKDDLCNGNVLESQGFRYIDQELFSEIRESKSIAALLTWITINKKSILNVHWPLFFSIMHNMYKFSKEVHDAYQDRAKKRGIFSSIKEYFTDEDKNATNARIKELYDDAQRLSELIKDAMKEDYLRIY